MAAIKTHPHHQDGAASHGGNANRGTGPLGQGLVSWLKFFEGEQHYIPLNCTCCLSYLSPDTGGLFSKHLFLTKRQNKCLNRNLNLPGNPKEKKKCKTNFQPGLGESSGSSGQQVKSRIRKKTLRALNLPPQ